MARKIIANTVAASAQRQGQVQQAKVAPQAQQSRPTSASNTKPASRPVSAGTKVVSAQAKATPHIYTLAEIKVKGAHVEDAFNSGAWLFDSAQAPEWLSSELPKSAPSTKHQLLPASRQTRAASPATSKQAKATPHIYTLAEAKCKHANVDDAFESGAWLFDPAQTPQWLSAQLPKAKPDMAPKTVARPASPATQRRPVQSPRK